MRHVDFSVRCIQRALSRIENDRYTPIRSSPEIPDYLIDLTRRFENDDHPFNSFVLHLPYDALPDELISQSLPEDVRDSILTLKSEHHSLQLQKEAEIAKAIFDNARDYRDRQEKLAHSISKLIDGIQFLATPTLINRALVSLGFDADALPLQNGG